MSTGNPASINPDDVLSEEERATHRKFAAGCFNGTWDLLDKKDRAPQEDFDMIHMSHASRYHWGQIGTPLEFARGDWQLSRVYAVLGMGDTARTYAQNSLDHCLANGIGDFDLAFAYEALARACCINGDQKERDRYLALATQAGENISDEGDRIYFFKELKTVSYP
jgi:hypothetical protein